MSGAPIDLKAELDAYGREHGPYDLDKLAAVRRRRAGLDPAPAPVSDKIRDAIESGQIHAATREQLIEALQWLHPRVAEVERDLDQMRAQYIEALAFWHTVNDGEAVVKRKLGASVQQLGASVAMLGSELETSTKSLKVVRDKKVRGDRARTEKRSAQAVARKALLVALLEKRHASEQDPPTPDEIADIFWSEGKDANPDSGLVKFVKGVRSRWGADVFKKDLAELRKNGDDPFS